MTTPLRTRLLDHLRAGTLRDEFDRIVARSNKTVPLPTLAHQLTTNPPTVTLLSGPGPVAQVLSEIAALDYTTVHNIAESVHWTRLPEWWAKVIAADLPLFASTQRLDVIHTGVRAGARYFNIRECKGEVLAVEYTRDEVEYAIETGKDLR